MPGLSNSETSNFAPTDLAVPANLAAPQSRAAAATHSAPLGLYVHIPFCQRKCPYCDFNTYAGLENYFDETVTALCAEMARYRELDHLRAALGGRRVTSVFIGGGTPTTLSATQLSRLFAAMTDAFSLAPDCEITCEANPGTVDRAKFQHLRSLGVNRLSLGVQSFQPDELTFLGRIHDVVDVTRGVDAARAAGFDNINLDFIFGLPNQRRAAWSSTLDQALALEPEHLSLYSLIVEPNTPLHQWVASGRVAAPDEDVAADLYECAMARLADAGYVHYEVSNWAKGDAYRRPATRPGDVTGAGMDDPRIDGESEACSSYVCRHNLLYWRNQEYMGIGPGAHSHLRTIFEGNLGEDASRESSNIDPLDAGEAPVTRRWSNRKPVPGYIRRMMAGESVVFEEEKLSGAVSRGETMMMGLRLVHEGVAFDRFQTQHGCDLRAVFSEEVAHLTAAGLLAATPSRLRVTSKGLLFANQVAEAFLAA